MSRRDTIIVAVLVNAGLLMLLFTTAIKSNKKEVTSLEEVTTHEIAETLSQEDLLDQYVTLSPSLEREEEVALTEGIDLTFTPVEKKELLVASPSKKEVRYVNVTVKKGDFLEKIARANKTTVAAIVNANNIKPTQLRVGQVLKVPITENRNTSPDKNFLARDEEYYTVKEGDNPWLIASRNRIDLETLLKLNGLDEKKAKRLRPGDRLRIQ